MKICVLGNSHVASLKTAWDEISSDCDDIQLTFFASRMRGLAELTLENNHLLPMTEALTRDIAFTSAGRRSIDLKAYDLFLSYGLGLPVPSLDQRYSGAVKRLAVRDILAGSTSIDLCKKIRGASENPIYIGHVPIRAERDPGSSHRHRMSYRDTLNLMNELLGIDGAVVVAQPEETLVNGWSTDMRFSTGSARLDVGDEMSGKPHPDNEYGHMNKDFGIVWLKRFFELAVSPNTGRNLQRSWSEAPPVLP